MNGPSLAPAFCIRLRPSLTRFVLVGTAGPLCIFLPLAVWVFRHESYAAILGNILLIIPIGLVAGLLTNIGSRTFYAFEITSDGLHHLFLQRCRLDRFYSWGVVRGFWRTPITYTVWLRTWWLFGLSIHLPSRRMLANGDEVAQSAADALRDHAAILPPVAARLLAAYASPHR